MARILFVFVLTLAACASSVGRPRAAFAVDDRGEIAVAPDARAGVDGALSAQSPRGPRTTPEQTWRVRLVAGEHVRVDLRGSFDTYLTVRPPSGQPFFNDDIDENDFNSRLDWRVQQTGVYELVASSFARGAAGAYRLTVARGHAIPPPPTPSGPVLAANTTVNGELAAGDTVDAAGRFADAYQFQGRRGDVINLELRSAQFDTFLTVHTPDGHEWRDDDMTPAETDSRLQTTLVADGPYAVEVSSFRAGATGRYTVRLEQSPRPTRAGPQDAAVANVAGRNGAGRLFGVFVGIRDYGGEAHDLPFCDDDATELARALRDRGVQTAAQQIVLTNAQATVTAIRAALATMATRVEPNDLLIVFYSGHGNQVPGTVSALEPDGMNETIRVRQGSVRDDELAEMLQPIRGNVLLVMDSCYSGGFARNVVSTPGRMGLFSSEEDVISQVAERYRAGGYLSYWVRLALQGEADANHDGTVRAGELAEYLYGMFAQHRAETHTTSNGAAQTFQYLVVARGSIVNTDLVVRLP